MRVIIKNTESVLVDDFKYYQENYRSSRCLHLKFSLFEDRPEDWFDRILFLLKNHIDDSTAQLYLCADTDIFILSRTMTHKRAEDITMSILNIQCFQTVKEFAALYEFSVDWPKIRNICEKKYEALKMRSMARSEDKGAILEKMTRDQLLKTLNTDLIYTVSERRRQRSTAEIMVVEDDPFSQRLINNALKNQYSVCITGDGQGALMNYIHKAPDVLFLDIDLPDMNGHEVLRKIFEFDRDAYVVMFSGNGDKKNIIKAVELGAKGFVGKPFTQEKLLQYIERSPFIQEKLNRGNHHGNPTR